MQIGRRISEFDEITEILNRAIAAAFVDVGDKGRAISRREDCVIAANHDIAGRITGMLGKFAWGSGLNDRADEPAREYDPLALHIRACCFEKRERFIVAPDFEADLF